MRMLPFTYKVSPNTGLDIGKSRSGGAKATGFLSLFCSLLFSISGYAATPLDLFRGLWLKDYQILEKGTAGRQAEGCLSLRIAPCSDKGNFLLFSGEFEDVYRSEGPEGNTTISFWKLRALRVLPLGANGTAGTLRIEGEESRFFSAIPVEKGKGQIKLSHRRRYWSVAYDRRFASWLWIRGGIGGQLGDSDPSHLNRALHISSKLFSQWTVSLEAIQDFQSSLLKAYWKKDALDLATEFDITDWRANLGGPLSRWGRLGFAADRFHLGPSNQSSGYVNRLSADGWNGGIYFTLFPLENWEMTGSIVWGQGKGSEAGRFEGQEFSNSQLDSRWRKFHLSSWWQPTPRMLLRGTYLKGIWRFESGKARLDSWPFVSSFVSLFDGKSWSLRGEGSLKIEQYGIEPRYDFSRRIGLSGTLRFVRLTPEADLVSREWTNSDLFTILLPKTETFQSPISSVELLDMGLRLRWWIGKIGLQCEWAQIVPIRITRTEREPSEEAVTKVKKTKRQGGSSCRLTLILQR